MANPTFSATELVNSAARSQLHSTPARVYTETLPGVDGLFVQLAGRGGRRLAVSGYLQANAATAAGARDALLSLLRDRMDLADGATIATLVLSDSSSYPQCLMKSYTHGDISISAAADGSYTAHAPVKAQFLQVQP